MSDSSLTPLFLDDLGRELKREAVRTGAITVAVVALTASSVVLARRRYYATQTRNVLSRPLTADSQVPPDMQRSLFAKPTPGCVQKVQPAEKKSIDN